MLLINYHWINFGALRAESRLCSELDALRLCADRTLIDDKVFVAAAWWISSVVMMIPGGLTFITVVAHRLGILDDDIARLVCLVRFVADWGEVKLCWIERVWLLWLNFFAGTRRFVVWWHALLLEDDRLDLQNVSVCSVERFLVDVALLSSALLSLCWFLEWTILKISLGDDIFSTVSESLGDGNADNIGGILRSRRWSEK